MKKNYLVLLATILFCKLLYAQNKSHCDSVKTKFWTSGTPLTSNSENGFMFSIVGKKDVAITELYGAFSFASSTATSNFLLFTKKGGFKGSEKVKANWILFDTVKIVGTGKPSPFKQKCNLKSAISVFKNDTLSFYLFSLQNGYKINYEKDTATYGVVKGDSIIQILPGKQSSGLFFTGPYGGTVGPKSYFINCQIDYCDSSSIVSFKKVSTESKTFQVFCSVTKQLSIVQNDIQTASKSYKFTLYDVMMHKISETTIVNSNTTFDATTLSNGIYVYTITSGNEVIKTNKISITE